MSGNRGVSRAFCQLVVFPRLFNVGIRFPHMLVLASLLREHQQITESGENDKIAGYPFGFR
jgi:hypothetical protein